MAPVDLDDDELGGARVVVCAASFVSAVDQLAAFAAFGVFLELIQFCLGVFRLASAASQGQCEQSQAHNRAGTKESNERVHCSLHLGR